MRIGEQIENLSMRFDETTAIYPDIDILYRKINPFVEGLNTMSNNTSIKVSTLYKEKEFFQIFELNDPSMNEEQIINWMKDKLIKSVKIF